MRRLVIIWAISLGGVIGCGDAKPPDSADDVAPRGADDHAAPRPPSSPSGPSIDAEVGALDPEAVEAAFVNARGEVYRCFEQGNAGLDFAVVGGDIEVFVRVATDGSVRFIYPASSTIGHVGVERCVLEAVKKQSWPKPEGGDEGIARTRFGVDPPGRPAVSWSSADLGSGGSALAQQLGRCKQQSGSVSLSVTLYIDADGKVISAGAATGDENGIDAIDCAVSAARAQPYASPGSYPAKVTVTAY